jgi:hypothetical protein
MLKNIRVRFGKKGRGGRRERENHSSSRKTKNNSQQKRGNGFYQIF